MELYLLSHSQPTVDPMAPTNTAEKPFAKGNSMKAGILVCFLHSCGQVLRTEPDTHNRHAKKLT